MNLSGTVIICVRDAGDEDSTIEHQVIASILTDNQGRQLVDALLHGGNVAIKGCSNGTTGEFACSEMNANVTITITPAQALIERVRTLLDAMVIKIESDQLLSDPERGLLAATALPVYKYLTVSAAFLAAVHPGGLVRVEPEHGCHPRVGRLNAGEEAAGGGGSPRPQQINAQGSITVNSGWRLYGEHGLAPLR